VGNISGETRTLPLSIFTAVQIPNGEAAAMRLVIASVILAAVALAGSELYSRRLKRFRVLG
jgi:molybdate transport system permease protein